MNILLAITKRRRNLLRIDRAFVTDVKAAVDERRLTKARHQRRRLLADVQASFRRDCKAAR